MKKLFGRRDDRYDDVIDMDDMYDELEDEEYYADEEVYEDEEYYADEEAYEDEEYYADEEAYEGEEYYADEEAYESEEYYADEEVYEDEEYYAEEDQDDDLEYAYEDEDDKWAAVGEGNFFERVWQKILDMSIMDRIITTTGVAVLVLALVTGAVYTSASVTGQQVSSFDSIGEQLAGITVIGGDGLQAVADAELARINAANAMDDEDKEYDESEYVKEVTVTMNLTSIMKDLKVKFVNERTDKLVGNVPFSVEVTTPDGKTEIWTDDDKDGIIYKKGIAAGEYKVAMQPLEGEKYEDYTISTSGKKVNVKSKIEYEKVDVSDEVKDESEIDSKKEDTAQKDTEVESELKDTVAWEETGIDTVYVSVPKSEIKDPAIASVGTKFYRLAGEVVLSGGTDMEVGGQAITLTAAPNGELAGAGWVISGEGTWASDKPEIATVAGGVVTAIAEGTANITYTGNMSRPITDASGGNAGTETKEGVTGSITITVKAPVAPPATITGVKLSADTLGLDLTTAGTKTGTLTATVEGTGEFDKTVTWETSDEKIATVTPGADGTVTVTAVSAGTATITVASAKDNTKTATCTVTVKADSTVTLLTLDKDKASIPVYGTVKLTATTTPAGAAVTWSSDKVDIATVSTDGTVTGVKEGTAVITAKAGNLTKTCTVTVGKLLTLDKTTATVVVGGEATVTAKVADDGKGKVTAASANTNILTVSVNDKVVTLKGVAAGSTAITVAYTTASGKVVSQDVTVSVVSNTNKLTNNAGQELYVLGADGKYVPAVASDYYKYDTFYLPTVKYTGWHTINGNLYFYDANGKAVTGEQVIQGAKYNFASDGSLITGNGTFGIDVSKWNGTIDWNAVKNSGVSYVIIRCGYRGSSQGALVEDPKFKKNIKGATAAGLKVGVYFFSQAVDEVEAVEEASMVLGLIKDYKISYPVFLDVEASGGRADKIDSATRTKVIKAFCETIENSGYTAGVYANKSWLEKKMDASQLTKYKIWLAQYAAAPTYSKTKYDLWQYKSTGKVSGISGNVDLNLSYLGY